MWLEEPSSGSEEEVREKMFNARLLLDGYAQVMTVSSNVKYADMFVKFQREAREQGKGLWGAVPVPAPGGGAQKQTSGTYYIGNAPSKIFHLPTCEWAQKIAPHNRVEFKSREETVSAGFGMGGDGNKKQKIIWRFIVTYAVDRRLDKKFLKIVEKYSGRQIFHSR